MSLYTTMMESVAVRLQRPVTGRDASKGLTQRFETYDFSIPCNVNQASSKITEYYAQRSIAVTTTLTFFTDPNIHANDRLYVKDRTGVEHCYIVRGRTQPQGRAYTWMIHAEYVDHPTSPQYPDGTIPGHA